MITYNLEWNAQTPVTKCIYNAIWSASVFCAYFAFGCLETDPEIELEIQQHMVQQRAYFVPAMPDRDEERVSKKETK